MNLIYDRNVTADKEGTGVVYYELIYNEWFTL